MNLTNHRDVKVKEQITKIISRYVCLAATDKNVCQMADELIAAMSAPQKQTLTAKQIAALHRFALSDGQPEYIITQSRIPAQEQLDEYSGLIAYSANENAGVLQLESESVAQDAGTSGVRKLKYIPFPDLFKEVASALQSGLSEDALLQPELCDAVWVTLQLLVGPAVAASHINSCMGR